ncbi:hypothetical protein EJ02DRAFT_81438 [Clathrospora elynae]|uniref:Uncharacterized protein n=1 Tax=Clathrospora elynae TaxID=706981 RepID=A0A6A5S7D0_9PLEO|nr:hypothetical protein EJ02DRAFT_81438 [Clathrospora elynae]
MDEQSGRRQTAVGRPLGAWQTGPASSEDLTGRVTRGGSGEGPWSWRGESPGGCHPGQRQHQPKTSAAKLGRACPNSVPTPSQLSSNTPISHSALPSLPVQCAHSRLGWGLFWQAPPSLL